MLGAGVLDKRVACTWAAGGYDVNISDPSEKQRIDGVQYIKENIASYCKATGRNPSKFEATDDLK